MNRLLAWVVAWGLIATSIAQGRQEFKPEDIDAAVMRHSLGQFWGGVVVGKGGKIVFAKGYGVADGKLTPIMADTLFDIGSVSKQFTATGILRLEMDGKLGLDDPVAKFFPVLGEKADARAKDTTIKHLLTHTSGMNDQHAIQRLDFTDRDAAVRKAFEAPPLGKIGEKFAYSNAGYVVLAAVIEKASGQGFEEFMRKEVFKPADLTNTGFLDGIGLNPAKQTLRVIGRGGQRRASLFASATGEPWAWGLKGAGGVLTTMEDLVKWDAALRGDAVVNAAARKKLYTTADGGYALGWFVESTPSGGMKVHHGGATRGFRCQLARYIDEDLVVAVLTNETGDVTGVEGTVTKVVLKSAPSVELELRLGDLPMNQYKASDVNSGLRCGAEADGDRVKVFAMLKERPVATFWMPKKAAVGLLAELKRVSPGREDGKGDCGVVIGTMPYTLDKDAAIRLSSGLVWRVMKEYSGVNPETRQRIVDKRTTLVIMDEEKGFWPLIMKMNANSAADLVDQLEAAVK